MAEMRTRSLLTPLVALVALALPATAAAVPPINDDYLKSTPINRADTRLTREEVKASVDTTEATTQPDLFVPETAGGGGPENTTCQGKAFGKTVWYDLHPEVDGAVEIQTGGFDVAINVYEFDNRSAKILGTVGCSAEPGTQDYIVPRLEGGRHYTVQFGGLDAGMGPAGGDPGAELPVLRRPRRRQRVRPARRLPRPARRARRRAARPSWPRRRS